uniref:Zinc finger protein 862-like n=1 Tax=Saccoglossus kowalevskii TaxID=10224 RepID=A0ABM0LUH3_SACKO|nr:PREDICTED: zinc finger protein 862-like [Saccoglossus kowalevskii]
MQEMIDELATVISSDIYDLRASPFYSLLMDETTDVAILIMYSKYIDKHANIKTSFLSIADIVNGKAETIEASTVAFCEGKSLTINPNMAALGSDGASVMVGRKTGVATRLKERNSMLMNIHCVAHRLALAAAQSMDKIKHLHKVSTTLQQLYHYYQNSAVRAVDAMRRVLPSVITSLERHAEERGDATAHGLSMFVKKYDFIASIHMLSDVLPHLTRLSLIFQIYNKYIDAVVANLQDRFPDVELLQCFSVFDPNGLPQNGDEAVDDAVQKQHLQTVKGGFRLSTGLRAHFETE